MLIEPEVLAKTKDFLVGDETGVGYAVVDTQFQSESWGNTPVSVEIQEQLQPINSLRLRGGEPDALLAPPRENAYRGFNGGPPTDLPLAVIEAKGETDSQNPNSTRIAITQAHRHLGEVNVGYAAVPRKYITEQDRALAREVNVGLLAVTASYVELLETPRLVGAGTSQTADTIRFHARVGDTAVENLTKNHPKNAIGYALAIPTAESTEEVFRKYVIDSVNDGRQDAESLGLIVHKMGESELTSLGREAVRTIAYHHGGVYPALEVIKNQYGSSERFMDTCPVMGAVARQTLLAYPPTQILINTIEELMEDGIRCPTLAQVTKAVAENHLDFALDLFVAKSDRNRVLSDEDGELVDIDAFDDGRVYSTHTTFQYKALLYHVGILTERGTGTKSEIRPDESIWALETPF